MKQDIISPSEVKIMVTIYEFTEEKKTGPESIETDPPGLLSFQKNSLSGNYTTSRFLNDKSSS